MPILAKLTCTILILPTVAKSDFGQNWCLSLLAFSFKNRKEQKKMGPESQKNGAPKGAAGKGGREGRKGGPASISFFFLSLWVSSRGILFVFLKTWTLKCAR